MKKYAILLSGGINFQANFKRYKNDLEFVYQVLIEDCGCQRNDIQVLFANGKDLEYGTAKIQTKEASLKNLMDSLQVAKSRLNKDDEFILVVTNHGGTNDGGCINLWGTEEMSLKNLTSEMSRMECRKIVILGECYAGNILQYDIENSCIITANMSGMPSYVNPDNMIYDEFLYHFFSYIHDGYPDGRSMNCKGANDVYEAFQYASDMDVFSPNSLEGDKIRALYGQNIVEIPQIKCNINEKLIL